MISKKRVLKKNQSVIILYDINLGFIEESATFDRYENMNINGFNHSLPIFKRKNGEDIQGTNCFWMFPNDISKFQSLEIIQKELIEVQLKVLEISLLLNYDIPQKIKNPEINKMAQENSDRIQHMIKKFGYDPRDESWLEIIMAETEQERNWFRFEREHKFGVISNWEDTVKLFNKSFNDNISIEQAKLASKRRWRYLLGAFNTRISGNGNREDWKSSAKLFEEFHKNREDRMFEWTMKHKNNFPLVRTKKEIQFIPGPYFHQCLEKIPQVFVEHDCNFIKTNIILRVIGYDPETKYIRLDFTKETRDILKPNDSTNVWEKDVADYDFWVLPEDIEQSLEILEPLE